jgi:hypothetical protein
MKRSEVVRRACKEKLSQKKFSQKSPLVLHPPLLPLAIKEDEIPTVIKKDTVIPIKEKV